MRNDPYPELRLYLRIPINITMGFFTTLSCVAAIMKTLHFDPAVFNSFLIMSLQQELKAISQLSLKQQQTGLKICIKICQDVLHCPEQQTPRPVNIRAVVKKTKCYYFINILLLAGYYQINQGKQLQFNPYKITELKSVLHQITQYKRRLKTNKSESKYQARNTIKLEFAHKPKQSKPARIRSRSDIRKYNYQRKPTKLGRYRIGTEIGRGAFGTIYKCIDAALHVYAIKLFKKQDMKQDQIDSVMSEINILSSLPTHPNVIKLIDVVETDKYIGIILPYFDNGSLYAFIRAFGVGELTETMVKAFVTQILKAVEFLHKNNIIHRDIKAANVLVSNDGVCKVTDFGISIDMNIENEQIEEDVAGSPFWMAPETIEMKQISTACDVWAIGATAMELATGYPPYSQLCPMSALFRIVQDSHPPIPDDISYLFKDFLMQCFHKNPNGRPSAAQLLNHKWLKEIEFEHVQETL